VALEAAGVAWVNTHQSSLHADKQVTPDDPQLLLERNLDENNQLTKRRTVLEQASEAMISTKGGTCTQRKTYSICQ